MPLLHMETELVRGTGQQLQQVADSLNQQTRQLNQSIQNLSGVWQGPSSNAFANEITPLLRQLSQLVNDGAILNQRLQREVDEWEQVDSLFGNSVEGTLGVDEKSHDSKDNGGGTGDDSGQYDIPADHGDLFDLVREDQKNNPVKIIKIGDNDYLVTIAGTDGFTNENNWTHAFLSSMGLSGDYEDSIKEFLEQELPENANIHFAGHSQGGIVANNLADNKDFTDQFTIETITTYGAPVSTRPNPNVDYYRYEANGDIVPDLRGYWIPNPSSMDQTEQTQISTYIPGKGYYASGLLGMTLLGTTGFKSASGVYGSVADDAHRWSYSKMDQKLPFEIDSYDWKPLEESTFQLETDKTTITGQLMQGGTGVILKGVDTVVDYPVEMLFDNERWRQGVDDGSLPDVRGEVDRYMDRVHRVALEVSGGDVARAGREYLVDLGGQGIDKLSDAWDDLF